MAMNAEVSAFFVQQFVHAGNPMFVSSLMFGYECRVEINAQNHYQVCVMMFVCVCVCKAHFPNPNDRPIKTFVAFSTSADQRRGMGGGGGGLAAERGMLNCKKPTALLPLVCPGTYFLHVKFSLSH